MSEHGAALQTYNQELVKCLEDLKSKRSQIIDIINKEEAEKSVLEKNIRTLQEKLNLMNSNLMQHRAIYESYDKTIRETETGFKKILESSQALLQMAQIEADTLDPTNDKNFVFIPYGKDY